MRTMTLWMQSSLDGHTSGPGGELDWPTVGPELGRYFVEELSKYDLFVYGRRVYEQMASFWPGAEDLPNISEFHVAYSRLWKPVPKIVLSNSLERAEWNTRVVRGDIVAALKEVKESRGGPIVFFGGATTAHALIEADLIDEFRINLHPTLTGGGQRLFPEPTDRMSLELMSADVFDGAVPHLRYRRQRESGAGQAEGTRSERVDA